MSNAFFINTGLQPGAGGENGKKPFQRFSPACQAVETAGVRAVLTTPLKRGVNGMNWTAIRF
jgi:hypothetical protein